MYRQWSLHRAVMREYIAMLGVDKTWRERGIGEFQLFSRSTYLIVLIYYKVILETDCDNHPALGLYESLEFLREKRLHRFYMNDKDAFRLVLAIEPD